MEKTMKKVRITYYLVNRNTFYNILEIPDRFSKWYYDGVYKNLSYFTDKKNISAYKHIFPLGGPVTLNADEIDFFIIEDLLEDVDDSQNELTIPR